MQPMKELTGSPLPQGGDLPERILELSRRMLQRARLGDWDQVMRLSKERDELVHLFFSGDPRAEDDHRLGELLNEVFSLNRKVESLTRKGRARVEEKLRRIQDGRRALHAYEAS